MSMRSDFAVLRLITRWNFVGSITGNSAGFSPVLAQNLHASGSGVGGAKGRDQGERGPAKHAPDTEPDQRVTCAGPRTAGRARAAERAAHGALPPCDS